MLDKYNLHYVQLFFGNIKHIFSLPSEMKNRGGASTSGYILYNIFYSCSLRKAAFYISTDGWYKTIQDFVLTIQTNNIEHCSFVLKSASLKNLLVVHN